jgi:phosphatidylinositol alpha-mannosyltransferase
MKIGFVVDDTLDKTDGVQQYVLTLGAWFSGRGHEVHYLAGQTERGDLQYVHSLARNVRVRFNKNKLSIPLPARKRAVERVVLGEDFDILHIQMPYSPMLAARIVRVAPPTTTIIGTFHILPFSRWHARANRALGIVLKRNLRRFRRFISVSSAAQAFAKQAYGIDSVVIPNVVDLMRYRSALPFTTSDVRKRIVFVGRLVERKGCDYLLRAVNRMVRLGETGFVVDICGRGEMEAELKRYVKEHRLEDIVNFHGFVSEEDKARYLAGADVAVFPSLGGESFGIVLIEAMAAGSKVVIGGDNLGYATVLRPQQLVNPRSITALQLKITHYLHDSDAIAAATSWQRHTIKQYDVNAVGVKLLALYEDGLHKRIS